MPHQKPFPGPTYFNNRKRWKLSELKEWEDGLGGLESEPLDPEDERYLTAAQVKERYSVSDMWLFRRERERIAASAAASSATEAA